MAEVSESSPTAGSAAAAPAGGNSMAAEQSPTAPSSSVSKSAGKSTSSKKRNRKSSSRPGRNSSTSEPGPLVPASPAAAAGGAAPTPSTTPAVVSASGQTEFQPSASSLVIDVVCGPNRARLYVDGLRNGSKTPCVMVTGLVNSGGEGEATTALGDGGKGEDMEVETEKKEKTENSESTVSSGVINSTSTNGGSGIGVGTWMTPNQFQHASGRGTARDWKRSIKHNGTSLKALITSRVLTVDPPSCRCSGCANITSNESTSSVIKSTPLAGLVVEVGCNLEEHLLLNLSAGSAAGSSPPPPILSLENPTGSASLTPPENQPEENIEEKMELVRALSLVTGSRNGGGGDGVGQPEVKLMTSSSRKRHVDESGFELDWSQYMKYHSVFGSHRKHMKRGPPEAENGGIGHCRPPSGMSTLDVLMMTSFCDAYARLRRRQEQASRSSETEVAVADASEHACASPEPANGDHGSPPTVNTGGRQPEVMTGGPLEGDCVTSQTSTDGLAASLRRAINVDDRDAALSHIIHELRDYKKKLVEQLDASRRISSHLQADHHILHHHHQQQQQSPTHHHATGSDRRLFSSQTGNSNGGLSEKVDGALTGTNVTGNNGVQTPAQKELPDLVRSVIASGPTSFPQNGSGIPPTVLNNGKASNGYMNVPQQPNSHASPHLAPYARQIPAVFQLPVSSVPISAFPVDSCGAVDLSLRPSLSFTSIAASSVIAQQDNGDVLDLSCRRKSNPTPTAVLPPPITISGITANKFVVGKPHPGLVSVVGGPYQHLLPVSTPPLNGIMSTLPASDHHSHRHHHHHHHHRHKSVSGSGTSRPRSHKSTSSNSSSISASGLSPATSITPMGDVSSNGGSGGGAQTGNSNNGLSDTDNPLRWSVRDVIEFVSEVPGCQAYAETFKRFGVRGASLPVLTVDHMTGILRMSPEAARSLRSAIDRMMTSYASAAAAAAAAAAGAAAPAVPASPPDAAPAVVGGASA